MTIHSCIACAFRGGDVCSGKGLRTLRLLNLAPEFKDPGWDCYASLHGRDKKKKARSGFPDCHINSTLIRQRDGLGGSFHRSPYFLWPQGT